METSPEEFVQNLKNHPDGHELARMIFQVMTEEKFLSLYDALMPLNDGPLDHLLTDNQCKILLWNRFIKPFDKLRNRVILYKGFSLSQNYVTEMYLTPYKAYVKRFNREPNLSGIAWILKEKSVVFERHRIRLEKRVLNRFRRYESKRQMDLFNIP